MRITDEQVQAIRKIALQEAGASCRVWLFGSRLDDAVQGGDLDLMLELQDAVQHPAVLMAQVAGRGSRLMQGRKVDVVLSAPNLDRLPIHELASREGRLL